MKKILFILALFGLSVPGLTLASGIGDHSMFESIADKAGVSSAGTVEDVTGSIIKAVLSVVGLIFLVLLVYAGVLWMTARGDEGKVEQSKNIIEAAIIGIAITVSAYAITVFVTTRFTGTQ